MAFNLPPPGDDGPGGPGGPGGFPGGFPGLFPGFGKSFNFDVGGGWGFPGLFGGGFPGGYGGYGGPYVPVTPLGGLWGFKGDLIVPIVAIGVAIFIFILVVLAVKYALAWKLEVLDDLAGVKKMKRDLGSAPAEQLQDNNLNRLADIVSAAIYSEGCSKRILCEIGAYAREGKQYPSLIRLIELLVPETYHQSFAILRESSEGDIVCAAKYPCGQNGGPQPVSDNEIDVTGNKTAASGKLSGGNNQTIIGNAVNRTSSNQPTTPAPSVFGKFRRAILTK